MSKTPHRIILLFLVFAPLLDGGQTHIAFMVYRLIIILLLTIYILEGIKNDRILFYRSGLDLPIFAFLAISLLTTIRSPYLNMSLQWLLNILFAILFFYLILSIARGEKEVFSILTLLFFIGLIEAIISLAQFFFFGIVRTKGTFSNPNFLALYLICTGSIGLGTLLGKDPFLPFHRSWIALSLIPILLAVITTGSRAGFIVLSSVLIFFFWMRHGKKSLLVVLAFIAIILLFPNPIHERLFHSGLGDNLRPDIWRVSLWEMLKYPLGTGLGIYNYLSFQYDLPIEGAIARYGKRAGSPHSDYLQIGVELGIIGLSVFFWGLFRLVKRLRRAFISPDWLHRKCLLWGLSGGIIAIFAHTLFDAVFHEPALVILLATYVAIFLAMDQEKGGIKPFIISPYSIRHPQLIIGLAIVLGLMISRPTLAWYLAKNGDRRLQKGDIPHAIQQFEQALLFDPGNAYYHDNLAYTYFSGFKLTGDMERFNRAISELEYAIFLHPLEGKFPAAIGTLYYDLALKTKNPSGRNDLLQKALHYYQKAIKLHPFFPFRYNELGLVYKDLKEYEMAIKHFEKAIQIEPNFLPARTNLAMLYKEVGRYQDAKRELKTVMAIKERHKNISLSPLEGQYLAIDENKIQEEMRSILKLEESENLLEDFPIRQRR